MTSEIETMTTKKDHAAGVSTEDHPPGQDVVAVHHPLGITNRETSPKREEMKNNRKNLVMERRGDDAGEGAALGTGKLKHSRI